MNFSNKSSKGDSWKKNLPSLNTKNGSTEEAYRLESSCLDKVLDKMVNNDNSEARLKTNEFPDFGRDRRDYWKEDLQLTLSEVLDAFKAADTEEAYRLEKTVINKLYDGVRKMGAKSEIKVYLAYSTSAALFARSVAFAAKEYINDYYRNEFESDEMTTDNLVDKVFKVFANYRKGYFNIADKIPALLDSLKVQSFVSITREAPRVRLSVFDKGTGVPDGEQADKNTPLILYRPCDGITDLIYLYYLGKFPRSEFSELVYMPFQLKSFFDDKIQANPATISLDEINRLY